MDICSGDVFFRLGGETSRHKNFTSVSFITLCEQEAAAREVGPCRLTFGRLGLLLLLFNYSCIQIRVFKSKYASFKTIYNDSN